MILATGMKSIEEEIRNIIKKRGISLYRIAKDLGVSWESLYRSLLDGANPKWNRIKSLLDYLDYEFVLRSKRKGVKPIKSKPSEIKKGGGLNGKHLQKR
jgi:DNA-binding phage protein